MAATMTLTRSPGVRRRTARWMRSPLLILGTAIVVALLLSGLFAPLIAPYSPTAQTQNALVGPSSAHLLGTDEFGRDVVSRVLYGIRQDLLAAGVAVPIGAALGVGAGLLSGVAGWIDTFLQRLFDVMLAFTALIAGVTVASIVGPGVSAVVITVAIVNIPVFGRITRTSVLSLRKRDYVIAADVLGAGWARILLRHILPNAIDPVIVQVAISLSTAVFIEGAMSFVGLGVLPPDASLGNMLQGSANYLQQNPYYALGPMFVVTLLVLGFQLMAEGLTKGLLRR